VQTIRHEVWINADKKKVFEAITSRKGLDAWWGKALTAEPELDYVVEFDHGLGELLRMRITDLIPDERVTWRCLSDYSEPGQPGSEWLGHRLHFELETGRDDPNSEWLRDRLELNTGDSFTVLNFRHTGWDSDARWFAFCNYSWGVTLQGLKRYCEDER
jgi:uncharacterized protein YndB with AHSA1/START domain